MTLYSGGDGNSFTDCEIRWHETPTEEKGNAKNILTGKSEGKGSVLKWNT
jgi:hypothetical protein